MHARARVRCSLFERHRHGVDDGAGTLGGTVHAEPPGQQLAPPRRVHRLLQERIDLRDVGGTTRVEAKVEAQERHPDSFRCRCGVEAERVQLALGFFVSPGHVRCLRGQEPGVEALRLLHCRAGQPLGQRKVALVAGRPGPGEEELCVAATPDETQRREQQGVLLPAAPRGLGERPGERALTPRRDAGPDDVGQHGIRQPNLESAAVHPAGEESFGFEGLDGRGLGQPVEGWLGQRLTDRRELQHVTLGLAEVSEADVDQLDQAVGWLQGPAHPPDPALVGQRVALERTRHQLMQVQRVALGVLSQEAQRGFVDRAAEHAVEQLFDGPFVQRCQLDARSRRGPSTTRGWDQRAVSRSAQQSGRRPARQPMR